MSSESPRLIPWLLLGMVSLLVTGVLVFSFWGGTPASGPVDAVWDKSACAHCRMHLGEPAFAAQLQLADGQVHFYDDPGCLFQHMAELDGETQAIYFRHLREDRWIHQSAVAFVRVKTSPMGFGLGAVDRGAVDRGAVEQGAVDRGNEEAMDFASARALVLAKESSR